MKKFFEKHDLFKLALIFVFISVLLSWVCKSTYYSSGDLVENDITRVGLFDISTYGLLPVYYFVTYFIYLFVVAGFYKFLGSLDAYKCLTDKIAKVFKGKEFLFVAISALVFGVLASISTDYFALLGLLPFVISILSKMGVNKVSSLSATVGGTLIGIIGSTYSTQVAGIIIDSNYGFSLDYGYKLVFTIALFAIAYILLMFFTHMEMKKNKDAVMDIFADEEEVKEEVVEEKATSKKTSKAVKVVKPVKKVVRANTVPLVITLVITFVLLVLAYIGWEDALKVSAFTNLYNSINSATLFDTTIYAYILGGKYFAAFGSWDLFGASSILLFVTFIIKLIYRVPFDKVLDEYLAGVKKVFGTAIILGTVFTVLEVSVMYPVIPGLVSKINTNANFATIYVSGLLTSLLTPDIQYVVSLIAGAFGSYSVPEVAALALQSSFGVISFIAPTSVLLVVGLSMLDIKYKDWFKFIWKFVIAMILVSFVILAIIGA